MGSDLHYASEARARDRYYPAIRLLKVVLEAARTGEGSLRGELLEAIVEEVARAEAMP